MADTRAEQIMELIASNQGEIEALIAQKRINLSPGGYLQIVDSSTPQLEFDNGNGGNFRMPIAQCVSLKNALNILAGPPQ